MGFRVLVAGGRHFTDYPTLRDTLDALEAELNFKFPVSYPAFAERFGLGGDLQVFPYYIVHTLYALSGLLRQRTRRNQSTCTPVRITSAEGREP